MSQAPIHPADIATAPVAGEAGSRAAEVLATLEDHAPWGVFVAKVPISFARRHQLIGLTDSSGHAVIVLGCRPAPSAGADDFSPPLLPATRTQYEAADAVRRWLNVPVTVTTASTESVSAGINRVYEGQAGHATQAIEGIEAEGDVATLLRAGDAGNNASGGGGGGDLLDGEGKAPVVKLANALLFEAVKLQASDVHVQPREDRVSVRMRIDGVLFDAYELPLSTHEELVSRIKVMGRMNIAEKRLPQDGRATVRVGPRNIDLRLSTVPTSHGERVVFRLLDKSARLYSLGELGMPPEVLRQFGEVIKAEHGLVLVTGPTGSGKSTTLYGALQQINCTELNVLTLEDPIEYQLPGVSQMQVSEKKGMSFAKGLRSVLRQDPDIIMVGEIRDRETAELAIQAALTGHMVFSTLHTNDAPSAVTRLLDLGIEPYLVSSSLLAVMAQRLVRQVCADCGRSLSAGESRDPLERLGYTLTDVEGFCPKQDLLKHMESGDSHPGLNLVEGKGCPACRHTGYRGRIGLYEYLPINDELRGAIQRREDASGLKQIARRRGMQSLRHDGTDKALAGRTTVDEVLRVTARNAAVASSPDSLLAENNPLLSPAEVVDPYGVEDDIPLKAEA